MGRHVRGRAGAQCEEVAGGAGWQLVVREPSSSANLSNPSSGSPIQTSKCSWASTTNGSMTWGLPVSMRDSGSAPARTAAQHLEQGALGVEDGKSRRLLGLGLRGEDLHGPLHLSGPSPGLGDVALEDLDVDAVKRH